MTNIVPKIEIQSILFLTKNKIFIDEVTNFITTWNNDSPYFYTKTSGSTGIPKQIELEKSRAVSSALRTGEFFNYKEGDSLVMCLSITTIGAKMQLVRAAVNKMQLIICEPSKNPLTELNLKKASQISLVPLQLEYLLEHALEKLQLFKSILVGGAALNEKTRQLILVYKLNVFESFGMTETYSHIALRHVDEKSITFKALNGVSFSTNQSQLCISAPHLAINMLKINDLVDLISPTEFKWIGRSDFTINSGGYKFLPEQLEQKLEGKMSFPYFILGEKNEQLGQRVTLFVEHSYSEELNEQIMGLCKQHYEPYEIPKIIHFVPEFKRTTSGKLDRLETQKLHLES